MNIPRLILSYLPGVFFPSSWNYERLSRDEGNTENADPLHSSPRPRRLRNTSSTSHQGVVTYGRRLLHQIWSFGDTRKTFSWILSLLIRRDERRKEIATDSRTLPNFVESESERSNRLFQDRLDLYSETDIIEKCQTLNNKINDAVLSIVDEWSSTRHDRRSHSPVILDSNTQDYLQHSLGLSLFAAIRHSTSQRPPEGLENRVTDALQTLAVFMCLQIISHTFSPGVPDSTNHGMQDTFNNMFSQELQATALRWRALAYTHSCRTDTSERLVADYIKVLVYYSCAILILAGEESTPALTSRLHEVIADSQVVESALALSRLLKTGLFSVHLDVCLVEPGGRFRKDVMSLDNEKLEVPEGASVLCTVELGICEMTLDNISSEPRQGRVLLKPKVIVANS